MAGLIEKGRNTFLETVRFILCTELPAECTPAAGAAKVAGLIRPSPSRISFCYTAKLNDDSFIGILDGLA
jgi:hypothetical protein